MFYPYKKGNGEWTNSVPVEQEATPFTPLWSNGDGYQTNNLFVYRVSTQTATTTGSYTSGSATIIYNEPVIDTTDWYDTTTGEFTPQVAGWWQITAGGANSAGTGQENIISLGGAAYCSIDSIGLNIGTMTGFGYFNGVDSNVSVYVSTGFSGTVQHPQSPQTSFFQALYLRP